MPPKCLLLLTIPVARSPSLTVKEILDSCSARVCLWAGLKYALPGAAAASSAAICAASATNKQEHVVRRLSIPSAAHPHCCQWCLRGQWGPHGTASSDSHSLFLQGCTARLYDLTSTGMPKPSCHNLCSSEAKLLTAIGSSTQE
jgi:hypothetical protein